MIVQNFCKNLQMNDYVACRSLLDLIKWKYGDPNCICKALIKLIKTTKKIMKVQNDNWFLKKCKSYEIYPTFINKMDKVFKNFSLKSKDYICNSFKTKLVKLSISENYKKINKLKIKKEQYTLEIFYNVKEIWLVEYIFEYIKISSERFSHQNLTEKEKKWENLIRKCNLKVTNVESKCVNEDWLYVDAGINIPQDVKYVLQYGPKFNCIPDKINFEKVLTEAELCIRAGKASEPQKNEARIKIYNILKNMKHTLEYRKKHWFNSLVKSTQNFFNDNPDLVVLSADKVNKTVVMKKEVYRDKIVNLIKDEKTYKKVNLDPTNKFQSLNNKTILDLFKKEKIDEKLKNKLVVYNSVAPKIYGLPKLHKAGMPLRPITSSINSPTYETAKFLNSILKNIKNEDINVKSSFEFKNRVDNLVVEENELVVSFDVVSLFTSVPVKLAKKVILDQWSKIKVCTNLNKKEFQNLLNLCLDSAYCQFENEFYIQIDGLPMGSSLSPVVADLVLDRLFQNLKQFFGMDIKFIIKYVDDTFAIIKKEKLNDILEFLNSYDANIKFTYELEKNQSINFLDLTIQKDHNGKVTLKHFKKSIQTSRLINYYSHQPEYQKFNTAKNQLSRRLELTSKCYHKEILKEYTETLMENNYSKKFCQEVRKSVLRGRKKSSRIDFDKKRIYVFPFMGIHNKMFKNILSKVNESALITSRKESTLKSKIFSSLKSKIDFFKKSNVIYKVKCKNCPGTYTGETKQYLGKRLKQHERDVSLESNATALSQHCTQKKHKFNFENCKIINSESNTFKRKMLESVHILKDTNSINFKQDTSHINPIFQTFLQNQSITKYVSTEPVSQNLPP